jgi:S1-C subfamily serine protease
MAKRVIPVLIDNGRYEYAWLGISGVPLAEGVARLMDLPAGARGALVVEVVEDGPAWEAGLRGGERSAVVGDQPVAVGGDVIAGVDGTPIQSMDDLISYLIEHTAPGDEVVLDILRENGERDQVTVDLGRRPSADGVLFGR